MVVDVIFEKVRKGINQFDVKSILFPILGGKIGCTPRYENNPGTNTPSSHYCLIDIVILIVITPVNEMQYPILN